MRIQEVAHPEGQVSHSFWQLGAKLKKSPSPPPMSPSHPLRQFGAPKIFFRGAPACALGTAWCSSHHVDLPFFYLFFFLSCSLFSFFVPFFSSFFFLSLSFFPFPFLLFGAPLVTPGSPGPQSPPPKIRPWPLNISLINSLQRLTTRGYDELFHEVQ